MQREMFSKAVANAVANKAATAATGMTADVSRVIRNTYAMLALTLIVSAVGAGLSMAVGMDHGMAIALVIAAFGVLLFVMPRVANTGAGIWVVFAFTAMLGASLGPMLNYYLALPNGGSIVMQALGGTAFVFLTLSAYVMVTGKNFSFLGGFLSIGILVVVFASLGTTVAAFFGVNVTGIELAVSAMTVLLMSGFILYDTSRIISGGETNYLMATVSLYLDIHILFTNLLQLIGAFSGDD